MLFAGTVVCVEKKKKKKRKKSLEKAGAASSSSAVLLPINARQLSPAGLIPRRPLKRE